MEKMRIKNQEIEICRIYFEEGLSTRKIAEQFGYSHPIIRRILKGNGFKLRSLSEAGRGKFGKENSHWKGGKMVVKGYVLVLDLSHPFRDKDGYVPEHRLIIEKHLKRFLMPKEVVHHINGVTTDNRIENLRAFSGSGEHTRYHYGKIN